MNNQHTACATIQGEFYPGVGELWDCEGRVAIIAGNTVEEDKRLWVMDWNTGERGNAIVGTLQTRTDRFSVTQDEMLKRFASWAQDGNSHAMWFLGWWYEAINHARSVWYYVAALRKDTHEHKWAYSRIVSDAFSCGEQRTVNADGTITRYPKPDLSFLKLIPEMYEPKVMCSLWAEAVEQAEMSPEVTALEILSPAK